MKAIVFDFDGVLVESVNIKAEAFMALYPDADEEDHVRVLNFHKENGGMPRAEKIRYFETDIFGRNINDAELKKMCDLFSKIVEDKVANCPWVPGAKEFLVSHSSRLPLFVASATPQEELRRIVVSRNADFYFKGIFGSPKKKDEHIRTVLHSYGLDKREIVMVGDAMADFSAATSCDVRFVGRVPQGEKSIFPAGTEIVTDLHDFAAVLGIS